jgi:hypothetical protein
VHPRAPLLLLPALAACGSLSYYRTPPNLGDDTGETDGATGDDDDDRTDPTDETDPGPDTGGPTDTDDPCDAANDCDRAACASFCDGDGDGSVDETLGGDDCDDDDPDVAPGTVDTCDGKDNDCVGGVDGDADGDGSDVCDDCDDDDPDRAPANAEVCNDGIDQDCDGTDCQDWSDGFEAGVGPDWSSSGNQWWTISSVSAHTGANSAASGTITHSQISRLTLVATFAAAGSVSFWYSGETESNYDYFRFFIDGTMVEQQAGTWPWTQMSYNVPAGAHTFEWTYEKDISVSVGLDSVAIDDVELTNGAP